MKFTLVLALAAGAAQAQKKSGDCRKTTEIENMKNPLQQYEPKDAQFPCDFGKAIPLGKIPKGCGKLEFIYARGTSEPGQLGVVCGDPVLARLQRDLPGVKVLGYPVQYPASLSGQATGVSDIGKRLASQMTACPESKFVLGGYSQGGMLTTQAVAKLSKEQQDKVIAVVLYGAGDGSKIKGAMNRKTIANCAPGDPACPNSGSGPGHVSYNNVGTVWHDRTSKYVVAAYNGQSQGNQLKRSPKN